MGSVPIRSAVAACHGVLDFAAAELERLGTEIILPTRQGFRIFRDYMLKQQGQAWHLTRRGDTVADFTSSRTALAWCIADKHQQWHLAQRILQLDQRLEITERGLAPRLQRWRAGSQNSALVAKIQHRQQQRHDIKHELDKCVSRAKYLQIRGLQHDTQRNKQS